MSIRRLILGLMIAPSLCALIFAVNHSRAAYSPTLSIAATPEAFASHTAPAAAAGLRYRLDAGQSKFTVHALVGGLLSSFGHNHTIAIREFSGDADLTPNTIEPASLQMTIKADSLTVTDKVSASDKQEIETKMRNEVLETAQHPNIIFKSTNISASKTAEGQYDTQIWGDVTLHGVTKSIWFKAQMSVSGNTLRAKGDFALRQSEFKIKPVSAAGGTIKVKDELKFSFEIVAVK
ncbi:MAG: YceI family protein [Acidobacteria bacterium]|nr:YceI family protein [Acidobacteriota bacterium]